MSSSASSPGAAGDTATLLKQMQELRAAALHLEKQRRGLQKQHMDLLLEQLNDLQKCVDLAKSHGDLVRVMDQAQHHQMAVRPPPSMTLLPQVTASMRDRQRRSPEKWAMSMCQWNMIIDHCKSLPEYSILRREKRYVNMYDLNQLCVKPWTAGSGCGLSILMNPHAELAAALMISHAWGEDAEELQAALAIYCVTHRITSQAPIWFCVFANYQPEDGAGPSISEQLAMEPFKRVIQSDAVKIRCGVFGMCAVHTTKEDLYERLWCVHEVDAALEEQVEVNAAMSEQYVKEVARRVDLFMDMGCNFESCLRAAGIFVNSCKAKCGWPRDEAMLIEFVQQKGGFKRLDDVIADFRKAVLPQAVSVQLDAVAQIDYLEEACQGVKDLRVMESFKIDEFRRRLAMVKKAQLGCRTLLQKLERKPQRLQNLLHEADVLINEAYHLERRGEDDKVRSSKECNVFHRRLEFTRMVDMALESDVELRQVMDSLKAMRGHIIDDLQSPLPESKRCQLILIGFVLQDQLGALSRLTSENDMSARKMLWQSEVRFHEGVNGLIECKCGNSVVPVGGQPAATFLVTTDVTREARPLLIKALAQGCPCIVVGPAGSGKTETAQDTAKMLGRTCEVLHQVPLNATPDFWTQMFVSAGATWPVTPVIIDSASKLPGEMLIAVADMAASPKVPLFLTAYALTDFPQEVLHSSLVVSMRRPPYKSIVSNLLMSEGFKDCDELANMLDLFMHSCESELTNQVHYDWGFRKLKMLSRAAGASMRREPKESEIRLVAIVVWQYLIYGIVKEDEEVFNRLLWKYFGFEPPPFSSGVEFLAVLKSALRLDHTMLLSVESAKLQSCKACIQRAAMEEGSQLFCLPNPVSECTAPEFLKAFAKALQTAVALSKAWVLMVCGQQRETPILELFSRLEALSNVCSSRRVMFPDGELIELEPGTRLIVLMMDRGEHLSAQMRAKFSSHLHE